MTRLAALTATETRLLTRDATVMVFAFLFPAFVMLTLAGVFGSEPDDGFGMQRPDDYYVVASLAVPTIALTLIGLPIALASYRERGVLRRLEAFGVSTGLVVTAQAIVTAGLVVVGMIVVLAVAAVSYGIPEIADPVQTLLGLVGGVVCLLLLGVAIGLAAPTARAAQAIGLGVFFPLYLLGGGGPPPDSMPDAMQTISGALPPAIGAVTDPWLGAGDVAGQLAVLGVWGAAALLAIAWLTQRQGA
ncbi:MAG TPA: ABC transporter permease [Capillimicrobium sp.]|jgi:ABC-2 type transport system permease protein